MKSKSVHLAALAMLTASGSFLHAAPLAPVFYVHVGTSVAKSTNYAPDPGTGRDTRITASTSTTVSYYITEEATRKHLVMTSRVVGRQKKYTVEGFGPAVLWTSVTAATPNWTERTTDRTLAPITKNVFRGENFDSSGLFSLSDSHSVKSQLGTAGLVSFVNRPAGPVLMPISLAGGGSGWSLGSALFPGVSRTSYTTSTKLSKTLTEKGMGTTPIGTVPFLAPAPHTLGYAAYQVAASLERAGFVRE